MAAEVGVEEGGDDVGVSALEVPEVVEVAVGEECGRGAAVLESVA